jgi:hypothetical protein
MPTPNDQSTTDRAGEQIAHEARVAFTDAGNCPEFVELYPRLREALSAEQWELASRMIGLAQQATAEAEHEELLAMVDGIARHFPGQAPAIRAVARHLFDAAAPRDCGVLGDELGPDGRPAREWLECLGPKPAA